jgi:diacylglycerol kinase family enzyme
MVAPGLPLRWVIIANPVAGGFALSPRWKKNRLSLEETAVRARAQNPLRPGSGPADLARQSGGLVATSGPGHAGRIVEDLLEEAAGNREGFFYLVICAGGDGTSREALSALYAAPEELRKHCAVLRLPMGTGNDGADSWNLGEALDLLVRPSRIDWSPALKLSTAGAGKGPFLAFNILSLGLDAFVTHMTNKMKGRFPGDSYKLWVDIAALLYDRIYRVGPMRVRAFDGEGRVVQDFRDTPLLLAVGVSGRRTYGSRQHILPDDRNVCMMRQMPLLRKIALKGLVAAGRHIAEKEALLFNASRVEFAGEHPVLAQMDGETVRLEPQDFPGIIELGAPVIPLLKRL